LVLTDSAGSVYLAPSSPHNVLEVKTAAHYLAGRFSAVDFTFNEFNAPVTVTIPTNVVIPDTTHMPGYFNMKSVDLTNCNSTGCTAKGVVQSEAGSGTAAVTFIITNDAGAKLASCTTSVAVASYTATPTATCHAHGAPWAHFWDMENGATYTLRGTVANPDYSLTGVNS
jgi:hypothetical protein